MKLLMCNVAWMREYQGITDIDYPVNGGEFIKEHGYGHEVINFKNNGNYVYGFVQAQKGTIDINRLDEDADDYIDNILVVWRARSAEGSVVIGWYKDAKVYRKEQAPNNNRFFDFDGIRYNPGWHIQALYSNVTLIPTSERTFVVPVTHKGFGSQTFVSYLQHNSPEVQQFKEKLFQYIERVENGDFTPPIQGNRQPIDQEINLKIEKNAIDIAIDYYTRRGYDVVSVEGDRLGYDLLAKKKLNRLYIGVKGTSNAEINTVTVGLTPNEYKMSKKAKRKYRICVVCNALETQELYEFMWKEEEEFWFDDRTMKRLEIEELISANLTILG